MYALCLHPSRFPVLPTEIGSQRQYRIVLPASYPFLMNHEITVPIRELYGSLVYSASRRYASKKIQVFKFTQRCP